jgi:serine protease Do
MLCSVGSSAVVGSLAGTAVTGCGSDVASASDIVEPPVLEDQKAAARGLIAAVDAAVTPAATPLAATSYDPRVSLAPMIEKVGPAVVSIRAQGRLGRAAARPSFFGSAPPPVVQGTGSGFVLSADGIIVTNNHVVDGATELTVHFSDEREMAATILGTDAATDLAVLKVEGASGLPTVELGDSTKVRVGDWVVAIGSPMGLAHSASVGIVSAKGRGSLGLYGDSYLDFLQTDADIAPGSSGGPLFDLEGRVVGINTAVGAGAAPGFAIPIDQVKAIVPELRDKGKVVRGWLGAASAEEDKAVIGARVGRVFDKTPAADGGLVEGDVIKTIDGNPVKDFEDLRGRIATITPGHTALLEVERDGKTIEVSVVIAERPEPDRLGALREVPRGSTPRVRPIPPSPAPRSEPAFPSRPSLPSVPTKGERLGVQARETDAGVEVAVVDDDGLADRLGIEAGDVLRTINGRAIKSTSDVPGALADGGATVEVEVVRDGASVTLSMTRSAVP